MSGPAVTRDDVARRFREFAATCAGYAPLYEALALAVSRDAEMLALAAASSPGQPPPNLLFGAVHLLLLRGERDPLARHYPSLTPRPDPPDAAWPRFRAFCLERAETIATILSTRRVQTNEVGRCATLYPCFAWIAARVGSPLALVEIGSSAGLNLAWDRYRYRFGDARPIGEVGSPVVIRSAWRGGRSPPLPARPPPVAWRAGTDLHPVDPADPEQGLWLRALVWPEHRERAALLAAALEVARAAPQRVVRGDGVSLLPALLEEVPAGAAPCIFHTHALYQFPEDRQRLRALVDRVGRERDIVLLGAEEDRPLPALARAVLWRGGRRSGELLARAHGHGAWIEWVAPA
jgi:hypothetical protein